MKKTLSDIVLIRISTILLLVVYHSFIIYGGGWNEPIDFTPIRFYFWISQFSYCFMLEMFVFISGYLFAFQQLELKKNDSLKGLIIKKTMRLLFPSIVFSLVYYLIFIDKPFSVAGFIYDIINGVGHMWFLPMLFWCFIGIKLLLYFPLKDQWKLLLLAILALCSFLPLPFQLTSAMYYIYFFYLGYVVWKYKDRFKLPNVKSGIMGLILFLFVFLGATLLKEYLLSVEAVNIMEKVGLLMFLNFLKLTSSMIGLIVTYVWINFLLKNTVSITSNILLGFSSMCFGVYLYQQFILQFLYYKTTLPIIVGPYWLPWLGLILTMILSITFTYITLKTRVGKLLIG